MHMQFRSEQEIENYKKFLAQRRPANPVFLEVWGKMQANGDLDNLDDDEVLEAVLDTTEEIMESHNHIRRTR